MECYSNYKSHEEEIMKIANEDNKEYFDPEITIKEEWNRDEDFEDFLSFPSENKGSDISEKGFENWSDSQILTVKDISHIIAQSALRSLNSTKICYFTLK